MNGKTIGKKSTGLLGISSQSKLRGKGRWAGQSADESEKQLKGRIEFWKIK